MKANELRIGNWVYDKKLKGNIEFKSFFGLCNIENNPDAFEPIPLTEEWLLKFGFEKAILPDFYGIKLTHGEVLEVKLNGTICIGSDYNPPMIPFRCKYVHQVQNLYFALTGQELEIQELEKNES